MWRPTILMGTVCSLSALLFWGTQSGPALAPAQEAPVKVPAEAVAAPAVKALKEAVPAPPVVPRGAANHVTSVTIYPNSALVTREVEVPVGQGLSEVTVTPLPPTTVQSSLYAEGTEGIRVLSTRFRTRPILEDTREEVRKLQDEIKQLQQSQDKAESDMKAVQSVQQYLAKLESFTTGTTMHTAEKGTLNSDSAIALSKYIIETRTEKFRELTTLQHSIQTIQEKMDFSKRKLADLTTSPSRTEHDAIISLDKVNAAGGKVRLNYLVESASWRPQYKLRAGKEAKEPVRLEYLAAVTQHTGEDWSGVKLVLSTAEPMLNAAPPDLHVLNVSVKPAGTASRTPHHAVSELEDQVKMIRSKAQKEVNDKKPSSGAGLFNTAAALDQSWELLNPDAAVKRACALSQREGPSVIYHLNSTLTVPSRNDEQVIEVTRFEVTPDYYFKAVPVITTHVYRLADLTNKSKYVLLPGDATMYIGSDFVGQQSLPLVAIGETFTAGFGVDPQLQVQRQMIDRMKTMSGGNQSLRYDYRILASSYKSEKVRLQIWDRLPHADTESVGVTLIKTSPEVSKDALYLREQRPTNLLRWDVEVEPSMTGEKALAINYQFKLELDRQMTISSFESASTSPVPLPAPVNPSPKVQAPAPPPAQPAMTSTEEAKIKVAMARLTPEDRKLAETQVWCAIDQDSRLGSTGPILKEMVKGRPVLVCCRGCAAEVRSNPDNAIRMLDKLMAQMNSKGGK